MKAAKQRSSPARAKSFVKNDTVPESWRSFADLISKFRVWISQDDSAKIEGSFVQGFAHFLQNLPKIVNAKSDVSLDNRMHNLNRLSFFTPTPLNERKLKGRKRWKNVCYERKGDFSQFAEKIERKMRTCRCLDQTRLKSSWTRIGWARDGKRDARISWKKKSARARGSVSGVAEKGTESRTGKTIEMENRRKKRDASRERERRADRSSHFLSFFFFSFPRRQKDREIRNLVPFPIW